MKESSLRDIEYHIWNEGQTHHDPNMDRIESEELQSIQKINANLLKDIEQEIRNKADREVQSTYR